MVVPQPREPNKCELLGMGSRETEFWDGQNFSKDSYRFQKLNLF